MRKYIGAILGTLALVIGGFAAPAHAVTYTYSWSNHYTCGTVANPSLIDMQYEIKRGSDGSAGVSRIAWNARTPFYAKKETVFEAVSGADGVHYTSTLYVVDWQATVFTGLPAMASVQGRYRYATATFVADSANNGGFTCTTVSDPF